MRRAFRTNFIATLLFFFVLLAYVLSPVSQSADSFWTVPVMCSMLFAGNTNLDGYPALLRAKHYDGVECVTADHRVVTPSRTDGCPSGSHYFYWYPIATPLLALPLMAGVDLCLRVAGPAADRLASGHVGPGVHAFFRRDYIAAHLLVEVLLSSVIVALATVLLFLTANIYLSLRASLVLSLLFAFATSAWSTASRALWQHGPDMLLISLVLYLLSLAAKRPAILPWTAAPLVLAYFTRPSSSLLVAVIGAYVFMQHRRYFLRWTLIAAAFATPLLAYNLYTYHRLVQSYFLLPLFLYPTYQNLGRIVNGFAGSVISPSRGLFVFTPFLIFSLAGVWLSFRRKWITPLSYHLAAALVLHWVLLSVYVYWTGGYCYGPRMFADVLPLFVFFLIPAFLWLRLDEPRRLCSLAFYACIGFSVFVHMRGALYWAPYEWNAAEPDMQTHAWDWRDPQFLRGVTGAPQK